MKPLLFLALLALGPALGDQISVAPGPIPESIHGSSTLSPASLAIARDWGRTGSPLGARDELALSCMR